MADWKHLEYPHLTEKSMMLIDTANIVSFIVNKSSTKKEIKEEFEEIFGVKVEKVNTEITPKAKKKAYIKLKKGFNAADVAVKLGVV